MLLDEVVDNFSRKYDSQLVLDIDLNLYKLEMSCDLQSSQFKNFIWQMVGGDHTKMFGCGKMTCFS